MFPKGAVQLLSLLSQLYDHIITIMLYGKETLILKEVTSILLSNETKKSPIQEEQEGSSLVVTGRKGRGKERKVWARRRHVTFVTGKVIGRMTANIGKSG